MVACPFSPDMPRAISHMNAHAQREALKAAKGKPAVVEGGAAQGGCNRDNPSPNPKP